MSKIHPSLRTLVLISRVDPAKASVTLSPDGLSAGVRIPGTYNIPLDLLLDVYRGISRLWPILTPATAQVRQNRIRAKRKGSPGPKAALQTVAVDDGGVVRYILKETAP